MEFSLLNLLMVILVAAIGGAIAQRFGYPALMGEMVAGIIFGPMMLGILHESEGLKLLAEVGVFLMMLYIGIEVDHRELMKASWAGVLASIGAFVVPLVAGYLLVRNHYEMDLNAGMFIGLAMAITSLATKSRALMELKLLGTRVANVLLAAALICDTLALVVFAGISGFAEAESSDILGILLVLLKAVGFFGVTAWIGMRVFPLFGKLFRKLGFTERTTNFTLVIFVGLVFAEMAEVAGLHSIIGAFIAGLFIREEVLQRKVSHDVSGLVRDVSLGFLAPVFFVSAGFKVDISVMWTDPAMLGALVGVAILAKIIGTWVFYVPTGHGWREGLAVGAGMNGQGAVAIIIAEIGFELGLVNAQIYSVLVLMAFFTTALEPLLIKLGTGWLKRSGGLVRADYNRNITIIAGASPLARIMAKHISRTGKVLLIDNNANLCGAADAEGLTAIKGNVLSEDLLDLAGAASASAFIAMTANHEVNRLSSEQARDMFGVPLTWKWPTMGVPSLPLEGHAADTSTGTPASAQTPKWNEWITRKEVEHVSLSVTHPVANTNFAGIIVALDIFPLVIERKGRRFPAMVADELQKGDQVFGLRRHVKEQKTDVFEELIQSCPILDIKENADFMEVFRTASKAIAPHVGLDSSLITEMLRKREEESSTVVGKGVAIPHVIIDSDQPVAIAVIRHREGVVFPHDDADPVRFIFFIIGARSARNIHLRILSAIAQLFQDSDFEDVMMAAPDTASMREIILKSRRKRI